MASTFSDLGIELMSTGENAGTWGDKTNTNLQIVEKAIAGYVEKSIAGGAQTTALSITDGTTTESDSIARHAVIKLTGSITGNQIVTVPDSIEKVYIITNGTSGAFTVQFKTASGTGITFGVSEKTTRLVYSDGTNLVDAGFGGALDIEGRELVLDADGDTTITADTDDQIDIKIGGTDQIKLVDGAIVPVTDNDIDLGTSSLEFKDAFFDGTVTADAFAGPLTGDVTGNISGTAATVTTAAQSNITSLGTLTTLTVDNVIINGSTIGHTGDTDLITVASGIATVAGEVSMTTLDIGGTNVTSTAAELNILDGVTSTTAELNILDGVTSTAAELNILDGVTSTAAELNLLDGRDATHLAVPGKIEGTNFTNSLLVGHATTGTLNNALGNVGVGITSLDALTTGDNNVAMGFGSLSALASGNQNVAVGQDALTVNNSGSENTALGGRSSRLLANGTGNTTVGYNSGTAMNNADADYNILIGHSAGDNITEGAGNVIIGSVDAAAVDGDRTLKIAGYDGTTTTTWIQGDSSGNLTFKRVDTGDDNPYVLTLQTGETDIAASDILGSINFQAPDEGTGTDAILVAAGIEAVSEGDFSSSNNATKLSFKTAASEAAAEKMSLSSAGLLTVTDDLVIKSGGTIGGAGDTDLLTLGSAILTVAGEVQMTTLDIGGTNVTATAAELNLLDGRDATHLAVPGKIEGTNFTDSLLVGHSTTGTLSSAERNTGVGIEALDSLTSGSDNTVLGYLAGTAITTGTNNTFVGKSSGDSVTTSTSNVGMGFYTLSAITTGASNNTAVGRNAMKDSTGSNCDDNVAIGISALEDVTGGFNIGIGSTAGDNITSGSGNVIIGGVDATSATGDRQLKIAGYDGSTTTTWVSGDSDGDVTFAHDVILANDSFVQFGDAGEKIIGDGSNLEIDSSGNLTFDADGGINLDSDSNAINFKDGGSKYFVISKSSSSAVLSSDASDGDIIFKGDDGGSVITAATLDMSDAGTLILNHDLVIADAGFIGSASDTDAIAISSAGVVTFSGAANVGQQAITSSSNAVAWDASAKPNAFHVTTENTTFSAPSNAVEGAFICLEINYNGSHTIAFNTVFEFAASTAPTTTDTDSKTDILVFRYNGAVWQEVGRTLNLSES